MSLLHMPWRGGERDVGREDNGGGRADSIDLSRTPRRSIIPRLCTGREDRHRVAGIDRPSFDSIHRCPKARYSFFLGIYR